MNDEEWNKRLSELEALVKKTGRKPERRKNQQLCSFVYIYTTGIHKDSCKSKKVNKILDKYGVKEGNYKVAWNKRFKELEEFVNRTKRKPSKNDSETLSNWVSTHTSVNCLDAEKRRKINDLFKKNKIKSRQDIWDERFSQLEQYIKTTGKRPTKKTNMILHNWIREKLSDVNRAKEVNELLEKYNINSRQKSWEETFKSLELFIKETGKKPTQSTNKTLYYWVYFQSRGVNKKTDKAKLINKLFKKYKLK